MTPAKSTPTPPEDRLLHDLLALRRAVAHTLGRDQYLYHVLDAALATGHPPTLRRAWRELHHQPPDVQLLLNAQEPA